MPPSEWQKLLIARFDDHDKATARISAKLDKQDVKIDSIRVMVTANSSTLKLHDHRIGGAEKDIGKLDVDVGHLSRQTGKHRIAELQKESDELQRERDELQSGAQYWVRWVIGGLFAVATGVAGWFLRG